jgi:metal-dependent amidase/aminoacylase/carboxypeptidase family protein
VVTADARGERTHVMHACGHDMHVACLCGATAELAATAGTTATITLNFRAYDPDVLRKLSEGARRIIEAEAAASGASRQPEETLLSSFGRRQRRRADRQGCRCAGPVA